MGFRALRPTVAIPVFVRRYLVSTSENRYRKWTSFSVLFFYAKPNRTWTCSSNSNPCPLLSPLYSHTAVSYHSVGSPLFKRGIFVGLLFLGWSGQQTLLSHGRKNKKKEKSHLSPPFFAIVIVTRPIVQDCPQLDFGSFWGGWKPRGIASYGIVTQNWGFCFSEKIFCGLFKYTCNYIKKVSISKNS